MKNRSLLNTMGHKTLCGESHDFVTRGGLDLPQVCTNRGEISMEFVGMVHAVFPDFVYNGVSH